MTNVSLERLKKANEFIGTQEMLAIFGVSYRTLRNWELRGTAGFPQSGNLLGKKGWFKDAVTAYVEAQKALVANR